MLIFDGLLVLVGWVLVLGIGRMCKFVVVVDKFVVGGGYVLW